MNLFEERNAKIKNFHPKKLSRDFSFHALSFLILTLFVLAGIGLQMALAPDSSVTEIMNIAIAILTGGVILSLLPFWSVTVLLMISLWVGALAFLNYGNVLLLSAGTVGFLVSSSIQLIYQWDKVVVLRFGKFRKVHGPGLFLIIPFIDRIAAVVDTRIRATDFSAEKTITCDTVPVHVDALAFWMIWDAKKAVLEVENYVDAVILSAQTALRDAIGQHDLSSLLSKREDLGKKIQQTLDKKTNPWGVTILSIEITEIIIPKKLENAMSKQAQAERERQSRVILSAAEVEIADKFEEAAKRYEKNPTALQLRSMNMVYEGIRQNGSLMLLPSSALDQMNLGAVMGTAAFQKVSQQEDAAEKKQDGGSR